MKVILSLPLLAIAAGGALSSDVQFTDATKAAGIAFTHANSATPGKHLIETMGGGVALFDYNNDGRLDVFFTNGAKIEDPMPRDGRPDKSDPAYWNRLYRQRADGTFEDVTETAGVSGRLQNQYGMGAAVGDYDNDGFEDLYVTNYGANVLYRNNGKGTFADVTARAGVAAGGWSASAGFVDYDNDGHLDLFVTRYLQWSFQHNRYCGEKKPGYRAYCHPDNFEAIANVLFRNNGDGTFTDVSVTAGDRGARPPTASASRSPTSTTTAGSTSTWPTTRFPCFLFRTGGTGPSPRTWRCSPGSRCTTTGGVAGMGVDFSDYDNDGRPDVFVSQLRRTSATGCSATTATAASATRTERRPASGAPRSRSRAGGPVPRLRQRRVEGHRSSRRDT